MKDFPRQLKAVLVDFDGTLVDSLPALRECFYVFLERHSVKTNEAEFLSLIGPSLREIVEKLRDKYALQGSMDDLYAEYTELVRKSYAHAIFPFAKALDVLQAAKERGIKLALVTSAPLPLVEIFLTRFNLQHFFDALICSKKNEPSKPSPALYIRALDTLGVSDTEALAIEDSGNGVASAHSAGLYVIHYNASSPIQGAASVVRSWDEVGEMLYGYQTHVITPSFCVEVVNSREKIVLSDVELCYVEELWHRAQQVRGGAIFNGKMLSYLNFENGSLFGIFVEYKYYVAQCIDPKLKERLQICPIAISCLCTCQKNVLVGKRSAFVTDFPGCFELVPSGGIDPAAVEKGRVNLVKQTLAELKEETGIDESSVAVCQPIALFQDLVSGSFEVCMHIKLKNDVLKSAGTFLPNSEYARLEWMPCENLKEFIANKENAFVPLSLCIINKYLSVGHGSISKQIRKGAQRL